jgi:hypothetical protein
VGRRTGLRQIVVEIAGEAVVRAAAVDGAGLEVVDAEVAADMAGMAVATVVADTSR